jgi:hypothetical protein
VKFLEALEKSKVFSDIRVKRDNREVLAGPDRITLDLTAWYATI